MALVFGVEGVPIFEILFIITMLLFVGLIFVLLELKRLKGVLSEESRDIKRFENDINQLERNNYEKLKKSSGGHHAQADSSGVAPELSDWVKNAKSKGKDDKSIMDSLTKAGWSKEDIQKALDQYGKK